MAAMTGTMTSLIRLISQVSTISSEHCLHGALDSNLFASAEVTSRKVVNSSVAQPLLTGGGAPAVDWRIADLGSEMTDKVVSRQERRWLRANA
jgi:hypothetical protein